jgi:hypothetical protein
MFPPECFCHVTTPADRQVRLDYFRQLFRAISFHGVIFCSGLNTADAYASEAPQSVADSPRTPVRETTAAPGFAPGSLRIILDLCQAFLPAILMLCPV